MKKRDTLNLTADGGYNITVNEAVFANNCPSCNSKNMSYCSDSDPEIANSLCLDCGTKVRIEIIEREYEHVDLDDINEYRIDEGLPILDAFKERYCEDFLRRRFGEEKAA